MPTHKLPENFVAARKAVDDATFKAELAAGDLEWQVHPAGGEPELRDAIGDHKTRKVKLALAKLGRAVDLLIEVEGLLDEATAGIKTNPRRRRATRRR